MYRKKSKGFGRVWTRELGYQTTEAVNTEAKKSGNELGAAIKTQTNLRITTRRCSEGVEAQSREFFTLTLDERERWAGLLFLSCVNVPAAYSITLGFESWLRNSLFQIHFTQFYSVSPSKSTGSIWLCYSLCLHHPWPPSIYKSSSHLSPYGLGYSKCPSCNIVTSGRQCVPLVSCLTL
jgi:hypothetical protein